LAEKGFGKEQLSEMRRIINAEDSDIFDVLTFVAYALPMLTRRERADNARVEVHSRFNDKQEGFLDFALDQYVNVGVEELSKEKLPPLLRLRYGDSLSDAVADLGSPTEIGELFSDFQKFLYEPLGSDQFED